MWLTGSKQIWFPTNHGQKWKAIYFNLTLFNPNKCTEKKGGCAWAENLFSTSSWFLFTVPAQSHSVIVTNYSGPGQLRQQASSVPKESSIPGSGTSKPLPGKPSTQCWPSGREALHGLGPQKAALQAREVITVHELQREWGLNSAQVFPLPTSGPLGMMSNHGSNQKVKRRGSGENPEGNTFTSLTFLSSPKNIFFFIAFREEREGREGGSGKRETERERKNIDQLPSHSHPRWGLNPQPGLWVTHPMGPHSDPLTELHLPGLTHFLNKDFCESLHLGLRFINSQVSCLKSVPAQNYPRRVTHWQSCKSHRARVSSGIRLQNGYNRWESPALT